MNTSYLIFSLNTGMLRGMAGDAALALSASTAASCQSVGRRLPIGRYTIAAPEVHPRLGLAARLMPAGDTSSRLQHDRDGFYILQSGPYAEDGIIPASGTAFQSLMQGLKTTGGGELTVWP